jgi:hypothetical protein
MSRLTKLAERIAAALAAGRVRECIRSLQGGKDDWHFLKGEAHRTKPYPMGFYANDPNLYWAIGWGMHTRMGPSSRWLLRRILRASQ